MKKKIYKVEPPIIFSGKEHSGWKASIFLALLDKVFKDVYRVLNYLLEEMCK